MMRSIPPGRALLKTIARRAMLERGLLPDFSEEIRSQTTAIPRNSASPEPGLRDLRALLWCSIDNDDSKDLDQLSVAESSGDGAVKILVAVADVDGIVKKGSPIDGHARTNTTSVYTAAQIFPMLPEELSTDLTSLGEGEDRPAIVVEMLIQPDGAMTGFDVYRAAVRNHAKLAYDAVAAWLDGNAPAPERVVAEAGMEEQLRVQDRVARSLRAARHQRGALGLETVEPLVVFDGERIADLTPLRGNRAKELIEDFMIAANGVIARSLEGKGFPSLRRVLRSPDRWLRILALAADLGERLPPEPSALALEGFLARRRTADPDRFPDLSLAVVKLIGAGEYVLAEPGKTTDGHFGLAVRDYTHSTAPNRRFPDLVTQRLLKAALAGLPAPYASEELGALALRCTEQESNATKVERQVRKSAAALLLATRVGERFDAIVTGASPKGTWVRIFHPAVEGKVVRGFEGLDVGDRVRVELLRTDVERGFIDFTRLSGAA
jgi:VacB/RNase II family 3'-5' exoribonuclease